MDQAISPWSLASLRKGVSGLAVIASKLLASALFLEGQSVQSFPAFGVEPFGEYVLANPAQNTPASAGFPNPKRDYKALELTVNKTFANNWAMTLNYRYSQLIGNYEGLFRNDNGQSDPNITSLFDFPTNDPSYTAIGVPQFGYQGDIRYLGALGAGPLPLDRPHVVKVFGNYAFPWGLNLGLGQVMNSGKPLTGLAANPNYTNGGEIPLTPRGQGIQTMDGFRKRTPFEYETSLHADYGFRFGGATRQSVVRTSLPPE